MRVRIDHAHAREVPEWVAVLQSALLSAAITVLLTWVSVAALDGPWRITHDRSAIETLDERLARGEISVEEYEVRRMLLDDR